MNSCDDCCCEYFIRSCACLSKLSRTSPRGSLSCNSQNRTQHCLESSSSTWFVFFTHQPPDFTAVPHRCISSLLHDSVFHEHRQHVVRCPVCCLVLWASPAGLALCAYSIKTTMRVLAALTYALNVNVRSAHCVLSPSTLLAAWVGFGFGFGFLFRFRPGRSGSVRS